MSSLEVNVYSLSKDAKHYKDVKVCSLTTVSGDIQILPEHAPLITALKRGKIAIKQHGHSKEIIINDVDGLVKVGNNKVDIYQVG